MTINWHYETVSITESTNSDLLNRWHHHTLTKPTSYLALEQTSGRGRRGNQWISQKNQSLTFSLAYPFVNHFNLLQLQGLSLACGLSIIQCLCQFLQLSKSNAQSLGLGLKWPNDLLIGDRKFGGILVEGGQKSTQDQIWMVIGIGLNMDLPNQSTNHLMTTNLSEINLNDLSLDIDALWKDLTLHLGHTIETFSESGFGGFKDDWNEWDLWHNQSVVLHQESNKMYQGKNLGVNEKGYLLLDTPLGIKEISSGDLSLSKEN
jgi:BirA family biotin operon repressor/biotin-[acetyl-CoA-carboxylase] ligase